MKFSTYTLTFLIILFFNSCSKENSPIPTDPGNGGNNGYNFEDLTSSENLLDTILVLHGTPTPANVKIFYRSKNQISCLYKSDPIFFVGKDTFFINSSQKLDSIRSTGMINGAYFNLLTRLSYSNGLVDRAFTYDDNYLSPPLRKLGSYFSYANNEIVETLTKFINSNSERDSIRFRFVRNADKDIDSVLIGQTVANRVNGQK